MKIIKDNFEKIEQRKQTNITQELIDFLSSEKIFLDLFVKYEKREKNDARSNQSIENKNIETEIYCSLSI